MSNSSAPPDRVIGWDIGGAHLKYAVLDDQSRVLAVEQLPCPLWQGLSHLQAGLAQAMRDGAMADCRHAITMTGELADLFEDRYEGVEQLITFMARHVPGERSLVFAGRAGFLQPDEAIERADDVASANWLASATWAARRIGDGVLIDVGSTTTDLVPFGRNRVLAREFDDRGRLAAQELVYTGVCRTPVMALAAQAPFDGEWVGLMAEHFATTADVYRLTGELPQQADLLPSADGGPKTRTGSARRLARMLGLDLDSAEMSQWSQLARYFARCQQHQIEQALARADSTRLAERPAPLVGAGVGRFLVRRLAGELDRAYLNFENLFESAGVDRRRIADCAPAVAVAALAQATEPVA